MTTTLTSVASAAIIGGDLIIGLSDGSIINCGRVQGPQGLKGDQGPIGATGLAGADGNTIHTVSGIPDTTLGKDGDYAIDSRVWNIYGPRSAGQWGTATPLRGNRKGEPPTGRKEPIFGNEPIGEGGGSGGKRYYNTANLRLAGTGRENDGEKSSERRVDVPGGNIIPEGTGLVYQSNLNDWVYKSLDALDKALPVEKYEGALPGEGKYNGDMALHNDSLWIYLDDNWIEVGGAVDPADFPHITYSNVDPSEPNKADLWFCSKPDDLTLYIFDGDNWIPASPPVSLDGIEADITNIQGELDNVYSQVNATKLDVFQTTSDLNFAIEETKKDQERQDEGIGTNARDITKLRSRVGTNESEITKRAKKDGDTFYGNLDFAAKKDDQYWISLRAMKPVAWNKDPKTHGLILDIGNSNTFKQQFKIRGRGNRDLFEIHDDGSAAATLNGRLNVTEKITIDSDEVLTQRWVENNLPKQNLEWDWRPAKANIITQGQIRWDTYGDGVGINISATAAEGRKFEMPNTFEPRSMVVPICIYYFDESGNQIFIVQGTTVAVGYRESGNAGYITCKGSPLINFITWAPDNAPDYTRVYCKVGGFLP